jgi:hypothetical protein
VSGVERRLLAIYLNDHLAGATAGLELVRRVRGSNEGTELGDFLERLAGEIAEDRESLEQIMGELGIGRDRVKVIAAWGAEKAGRLKLNGSLTGYSPLSRVVELEGLHIGVTGKLALWQVLEDTLGSRIGGADLTRLRERAERQRGELESYRRAAAAEAFGQEPAA